MRACTYVCMYICMRVCMYVHLYTCVYVCIYINVCLYGCTCARMYMELWSRWIPELCDLISFDVMWCHFIWCDFIWFDVIWFDRWVVLLKYPFSLPSASISPHPTSDSRMQQLMALSIIPWRCLEIIVIETKQWLLQLQSIVRSLRLEGLLRGFLLLLLCFRLFLPRLHLTARSLLIYCTYDLAEGEKPSSSEQSGWNEEPEWHNEHGESESLAFCSALIARTAPSQRHHGCICSVQ